MRYPAVFAPSSPLPHPAQPPQLIHSPTSLLNLTASQRRARHHIFSRASSSEPTVAGGLANWRRQPKPSKQENGSKACGIGSAPGTAITSTTSGEGQSGGRKKRIGAGMGMQGTPAKKGKKSQSKSMGAHSTPATKILSRSRSHSLVGRRLGHPPPGVPIHPSSSSLNSSFPSSAEFLTPTPPSGIPDLSSPSIPAIPAQHRKPDVFDGQYTASPRSRTSTEQEDWDRLVQEAEMSPQNEDLTDTVRRDQGNALYAWKEDVMWSVRGGSETSPEKTEMAGEEHDVERMIEGEDETEMERTVYYDAMTSLRDNTRTDKSTSSARFRSDTIKNRRSTPYKSGERTEGDRDHSVMVGEAREYDIQRPSTFGDLLNATEKHQQSISVYNDIAGKTADATILEVSLNDKTAQLDDRSIGGRKRATKIKERKSTPNKSSSQPQAGQEESFNESLDSQQQRPSVTLLRQKADDGVGHENQDRADPSLLSQLLQSTIASGLRPGLSQLLGSTQSTSSDFKVPEGDSLADIPVEIGRSYVHTPRISSADYSTPSRHPRKAVGSAEARKASPLLEDADFGAPDIPSSEGFAADFDLPSDNEPLPPHRVQAEYQYRDTIPTPFTPSSHLSPSTTQPTLSPISFRTLSPTPLRVSPPPAIPIPSRRKVNKLKTPRSTRKGAWRGAEVLARMEAADRATARFHLAFDPVSPVDTDDGDEVERSQGKERTGKGRAGSGITDFVESDEQIIARERRIEHYRLLGEEYDLQVELVYWV